nr:hypothetical protein HK105_008390 [Polyrhizophydium stewartii]
MSVFPKETVHAIAETQGITLKDEVASVLLQDAEYRLREIIHEATKFMRHSHRRTLTTDDINSALSVRNVEPIYGFISGSSANFKSTVHNNQTLYYLEDQEYDLEDLINRPLPPVPIEPTYTAHWLAIDGVQPRIVQNPTPSATEMAPLVKQVLTKELQMYYEKITEMLINDDPEIRALAIESTGRDPGMQGLMPYFVQFVADTVTRNLKNLDILWAMMRFMRALLANPDLDPEPYVR